MQHDFEQETTLPVRLNTSITSDTSSTEQSVYGQKNLPGAVGPGSTLALIDTDPERDTDILLSAKNMPRSYRVWQMTMDILFALCGSLALVLMLPLIALLIVLDSPGPVFYSQERIGYHGKPFRIFKFRTMYARAEDPGQAIWANKQDKRITRSGRVMRAIHLDELPQVFNILRGEMSLIGPRPEREAFISELERQIPLYRYRLTVKPGLTGWAQVQYHYASSIEDSRIKLQYDLYYIEHQTRKLDMHILAKTILEVLSHHGT